MKVAVCILLFCVSFVLFAVAVRQLLQKGRLLNNSYIYAAENERNTMDKKPYYRQTGIILMIISLAFFLDGIYVFKNVKTLMVIVFLLYLSCVVYAVVSERKIQKSIKKNENTENLS